MLTLGCTLVGGQWGVVGPDLFPILWFLLLKSHLSQGMVAISAKQTLSLFGSTLDPPEILSVSTVSLSWCACTRREGGLRRSSVHRERGDATLSLPSLTPVHLLHAPLPFATWAQRGGSLERRTDCLSFFLYHPFSPFHPSWNIMWELKKFRNFCLSAISGFHEHCLISWI